MAIGEILRTFADAIDGDQARVGNAATQLVVMACGKCGMTFAVPMHWYNERREDKATWYCPNGHPRVFTRTREEDLRRSLLAEQAKADQLKADRDRERRNRQRAERQRSAMKGQLTKVKKRVAHGVCPCCNRTFQNLQRHMESQHPAFDTAE